MTRWAIPLLLLAGTEAMQALPVPWRQEAAAVQVSGRVVSRRRLGDCLLFVDLVPADTPLQPLVSRAPDS